MPKRISLTLLFTVAVAVVALFAVTEVGAQCGPGENTADYECNDGVQGNYTVRIGDPFAVIGPCPAAYPGENCTTYTWNISPEGLSHFNLIVERPFLGKIVGPDGVSLDCSGVGDPSQGADQYARFLTWNCFIKFSNTATPSVIMRGEFTSAPTDWFVKQTSDSANGDYGITRGPAESCVPIEPQIATATWKQTICEEGEDGPSCCTVEICETCGTTGGAAVLSVIGDCTAAIVDRPTDITYIPLRIWILESESPGCWYYTLPNGQDCSVCWY